MNNLNNLMMMGGYEPSVSAASHSPVNFAFVVVLFAAVALSGYFAYKFSSRFIK